MTYESIYSNIHFTQKIKITSYLILQKVILSPHRKTISHSLTLPHVNLQQIEFATPGRSVGFSKRSFLMFLSAILPSTHAFAIDFETQMSHLQTTPASNSKAAYYSCTAAVLLSPYVVFQGSQNNDLIFAGVTAYKPLSQSVKCRGCFKARKSNKVDVFSMFFLPQKDSYLSVFFYHFLLLWLA